MPEPCSTYTQVYRTGIVEVVRGNLLAHEYKGQRIIPSIAYEREIFQYLPECFKIIRTLGSNAPVAVGLTLIGTRGLIMATDNHGLNWGLPISQNIITLPETVVEDLATPTGKILKPLLDLVWNACGKAGLSILTRKETGLTADKPRSTGPRYQDEGRQAVQFRVIPCSAPSDV